jgi:hypothetical protein
MCALINSVSAVDLDRADIFGSAATQFPPTISKSNNRLSALMISCVNCRNELRWRICVTSKLVFADEFALPANQFLQPNPVSPVNQFSLPNPMTPTNQFHCRILYHQQISFRCRILCHQWINFAAEFCITSEPVFAAEFCVTNE